MVKGETTGKRPTVYSEWHRKRLPKECYTMDIDWVECRGNYKPNALIEASEINYDYVNEGEDPYLKTLWYVLRRTWFQRNSMLYIASKLGISVFIVIHDNRLPLNEFLLLEITEKVNRINWKQSNPEDVKKLDVIRLTEDEYIKFLVNL